MTVYVVIRKATYLRGRSRPTPSHRRSAGRFSSSLPSVRVNDVVLQSHGARSALGVWIMQAFRTDSTGSPSPFDVMSSSHYARHGFSRRAFIGGAAAATGAALGSGLLSPAAALASHSRPAPKPTTAVTTISGIDFHFTSFAPGVDPSSITDFKGHVGVADVRGTGTARSPDGSVETFLFDTEMRFMKGVYVGQDGAVHRGRLASFDWTSTEVGLTSQTSPPRFTNSTRDPSLPERPVLDGPASEDGVRVYLQQGEARMTAGDLGVRDFFNIPNALFRTQDPVSVGATVSFDIRWMVSGQALRRSPARRAPPAGVYESGHDAWSAKNATGFRFRSDPPVGQASSASSVAWEWTLSH